MQASMHFRHRVTEREKCGNLPQSPLWQIMYVITKHAQWILTRLFTFFFVHVRDYARLGAVGNRKGMLQTSM